MQSPIRLLEDEVPECPGQHCSAISERVNNTCKKQGHSGDRVYVIRADDSECYCNCSCLALNTPVAMADGNWARIQEIKPGDTVLTAQLGKSWQPKKVEFSDGTKGDGNLVPGTIYIRTETDIELLVTADHPFLMENGNLQQAKRLTKSDKLVDENFNPVGIKQIAPGFYTGGIWHISTSTSDQPGEPLSDHLLNTAGIISGDYYAQLYLVEGGLLSQPAIGTLEYEEKAGSTDTLPFRAEGSKTGVNLFQFVPYKKFIPPPGARSFLPDYLTTPAPGTLRPLDDTVSLENAEALAWLFKRIFPDVIYEAREHWGDNTANAYAWKEGDKRYIKLLGGLIRHKALKRQGISLIIAHELGHHYGGEPVYPGNGLSCEGQADYWAAWIAMREVFPGREYYQQMRPAIDQIYDLFKNGLLMSISEEEEKKKFESLAGCSHPPADCRRDTYLAAMRLDPKPICAGLIQSENIDGQGTSYA
jgi:hypothetical protein